MEPPLPPPPPPPPQVRLAFEKAAAVTEAPPLPPTFPRVRLPPSVSDLTSTATLSPTLQHTTASRTTSTFACVLDTFFTRPVVVALPMLSRSRSLTFKATATAEHRQ